MKTPPQRTLLRFAALPLLACTLSAQAPTRLLLPGGDTSYASAGSQQRPAIVQGANGYLVVWEDDRASLANTVAPPNGFNTNRDVYAARLDANGNLLDATSFVVNQDPFDQLVPRVAWNGENYLVVWKGTRALQFSVTTGIYAARVTPTGAVLDDPPIVIEDGDDFDETNPVVASDGVNWAVFYTDYSPGQPAERLDVALVHPSGFVVQKQTAIGGAQFAAPVNVDVEFAVDRYLVVYEKSFSGAYGRLLTPALATTGSELVFNTAATKPECASNGSDFFVSFSGGRGTPVSRAGVIAVPGGANLLGSGVAWGPETDCAWNGNGWALAFTNIGFGGTDDTLYLSLVDAAGGLVPGSAFVVRSAPVIQQVALANGSGLVQLVDADAALSNAAGGNDLLDVHASQVGPGGGVGSTTVVSAGAPAQTAPVIAGSASTGYLVAWLGLVSGSTRVEAQRLDGNGLPIDPQPITLHVGTRAIRRIDAAFDGTEWMVVWDDAFGTLRHTYSMRVALDGTLLDPAPVNTLRGERPTVAALDGARTFLVAAWDHNQSNEIIRAGRVDGASGALLDAPYLTLGGGTGFPDALGFDDRWFVVWGGMTGIFVDPTGTFGAPFYAGAAASDSPHGLARDGDLALIAFRGSSSTSANGDVLARRMQKDGTFLDPASGFAVCQAPNLQFDPSATFDGNEFRVGWTDYRVHPLLVPGIGDLFVARVGGDGSVPELCGEAIADDARIPEGDASLVGRNGSWLAAACVLHAEGGYGAVRVEVAYGTPPAAGTSFCYGDSAANACPCGNHGAPGHGCASSVNANGALLEAAGFPHLDDVVLFGSQMPATSPCVYLQGDAFTDVPFGDGRRCLAGVLLRLRTKTNVGGASSFPDAVETLTLSQRGGVVPGSGAVRGYQVYYRNASPTFCPPETYNVSNGIRIVW
ncbi:MAG: hypothetical protein IPJ77_11400 [Planctomycetes bacterium]|nr:hypothetical protein [Planctomycetota bacterium]